MLRKVHIRHRKIEIAGALFLVFQRAEHVPLRLVRAMQRIERRGHVVIKRRKARMICAERNGIQALRLPEERQSALCLAEGGERRGRVYKDRPARGSAGAYLAEQLRAPAEHRIKLLRVAALAVKAHQRAAKGERGAPGAGLLRFGERGKEYALRAVPVAAAHAVVRSRGYTVHCFFHTAIIP